MTLSLNLQCADPPPRSPTFRPNYSSHAKSEQQRALYYSLSLRHSKTDKATFLVYLTTLSQLHKLYIVESEDDCK
jgi:hypothetical protein